MAPFLMRVSTSCSITRACWGPTSVAMTRTRTELDSVALLQEQVAMLCF